MSDEPADEVEEAGPFRTPELTGDARQRRAREKSWARVARITEAQIEADLRRQARGDTLVWVAFFASLLALGLVFGLAAVQPRGPWAPLVCPGIALVLSALVAVLQRARLRRRPPPR